MKGDSHGDTVEQPLFVIFRLYGVGEAFVAMDRLLDRGASGPVHLRRRKPLVSAAEFRARHGQAFWQDESYDHRVRSPAAFDRIRDYIEQNPVNSGLVVDAREYPWSSAASRLKGGCGQDWPPHIPARRELP